MSGRPGGGARSGGGRSGGDRSGSGRSGTGRSGGARSGSGSSGGGRSASSGSGSGRPKGNSRPRAGSGQAGQGQGQARQSQGQERGTGQQRGRPRGGRPTDRASRSGTKAAGSRERGLGGAQVEGRQAVRELLLAGQRRAFEIVLSAEVDRSDIVGDIVELAGELRVPITEVSRTKLDSLSRTDAPQGVVARAAELPESTLGDLLVPDEGAAPFLLAVDGVTDPGNLGALLRIAECAGVTGVVLPKHRAVHVTPTVTKAAAGAVEYLPMTLVGGLPAAIEAMRSAGIWVVGLDAGGDTPIHDIRVADSGVCLVLGAEGKGLSRLVRQRCDLIASIPLHGRLAFLNVASAGAIACYELARSRSADPQNRS